MLKGGLKMEQVLVLFAAAIMISFAAVGTAFGFAMLGGKLLDSTARQPEMAPMLQSKFFIIAGLLDAVPMISVGLSMYLIFVLGA